MKEVNCPESHHLGLARFLGNSGNTLQVCLAFGPGTSDALSSEKGAGAGTCLLLPYSIAPCLSVLGLSPAFFLKREVIRTRSRMQARVPCRGLSFGPSYFARLT